MPTDQSETKNLFRINRKLKDRVPFAVIGSNCVLQINEKRIRARQYPWGIAEVENSDHCDFKILRDMLIRTHMQVIRCQKQAFAGRRRPRHPVVRSFSSSEAWSERNAILLEILGSDRCYISGSLRKLPRTKTLECYELKTHWKESNRTNGRRKEVCIGYTV